MQTFIVYKHNHAGWFRSIVEAESEDEAKLAAIYQDVPWLKNYSHTITFNEYGYTVSYTGEPRSVALGRTQYPGHWWSEEIRFGAEDDCMACGGTGKDHYSVLGPCRKCKGVKKSFAGSTS